MDKEVYTRQFRYNGTWGDLFDTFEFGLSRFTKTRLFDLGVGLEFVRGANFSDMSPWAMRNFEYDLADTEYVGRLDEARMYARYSVRFVGSDVYEITFDGYEVIFNQDTEDDPFTMGVREVSDITVERFMGFVDDLLSLDIGLGIV